MSGLSCAGPPAASDDPRDSLSGIRTELLSPGEEPRSDLRFRVAKGDTQHVTLTTDVEKSSSLDGASTPDGGAYTQQLTVRVTVTGVAANGDVSFETSIVDAKVTPRGPGSSRAALLLQRAVQSTVGLGGRFIMSSRGVLTSHVTEVNDALAPAVRQMVEGSKGSLPSISIPLPEEPIGVGARWSVRRPVGSQGVEAVRDAVYELKSYRDGAGTISLRASQSLEPQDGPPAEGPGLRQRVIRLHMTSEGRHAFSLSRILPTSGEITMESEAEFEMTHGEERRSATVRVSSTQRIEEVTNPAARKSTRDGEASRS